MTLSPPDSRPSDRPKGVRVVRAQLADGSTAVYWYCRLTNTRLPPPDDPGFAEALAKARAPRIARHRRGTLGHMIDAWRASPAYTGLADRTRDNRDRYLRAVEVPAWADRMLAEVKRAALLELRDAIAGAHGPAAANMFLMSLSSVFSWAVDRGLAEFNPLARAKALPGGHFAAWTEPEARLALAQFREEARRAVLLAYHIGQRRGDLAALTWAAYDGRTITLMPEKTRRWRERKGLGPLRLPVHSELRAELDRWKAENARRPSPALTILTSPTGRAWGREALTTMITAEVRRVGLRDGLNLHGFRKLAANRLAEAHATTKEISAALGWESLAHVELYTRGADQHRLAEAAILRLEKPLAKTGKRGGK